jgi:hypothetical protein
VNIGQAVANILYQDVDKTSKRRGRQMVYRPTVRYDDRFKDYVNDLFHATTLDRNQIMRLALFLLGHTKEGNGILSEHLKKNTSLPSPSWSIQHGGLWKAQATVSLDGGRTSTRDVTIKTQAIEEGRHAQETEVIHRSERQDSRPSRTIYPSVAKPSGILINVGGRVLEGK